MRVTFLGGAKVVTGANYLLEVRGQHILVDCGLFQGSRELTELNWEPFAYDPKSIDAVCITHSHLDHCGRLPKLQREGFRGVVYCTQPTRDIMEASLHDSARVLEYTATNLAVPPLYEESDVAEVIRRVHTLSYDERHVLAPGITLTLRNAGHILGSAMAEFEIEEVGEKKKLLFTGDLGNCPNPILPPTHHSTAADYVFIESAYGDRNHEDASNKLELLCSAIKDVIARHGTMLIPSFAIERTQELLYHLNELVETGQIPPVPVFIDSPLATTITGIYKKYDAYFNTGTQSLIASGDDIFHFPLLRFTVTKEESKTINRVPPPKIIIAGSGMSTGGRILFHEKLYLSDPNNMLLIVGYQVEGTVGRAVLNGEPIIDILGERVKNKIEVRAIGGYSAHADQQQLVDFISRFNPRPKNVYIVQGEHAAALGLQRALRNQLGYESSVVPTFEDSVEL